MHELPEGLTQSLRSWRGSISSSNRRHGPPDLESHGNLNGTKSSNDNADKDSEHELNPTDSSLVLVSLLCRPGREQCRLTWGSTRQLQIMPSNTRQKKRAAIVLSPTAMKTIYTITLKHLHIRTTPETVSKRKHRNRQLQLRSTPRQTWMTPILPPVESRPRVVSH